MAKQGGKDQPKQKSLKDQRKELEGKLFGEKNSSKKKELQNMIKKIDLQIKQETEARQKAMEEKKAAQHVKQLIPVGVDPKTVQCINFLNGTCDKGDNCQFGHFTKKEAKKDEQARPEDQARGPCRFMLDALEAREYGPNWKCPIPGCKNKHQLTELGNEDTTELTLEEYLEIRRQSLGDSQGTPVTQETFAAWKAKKQKEDELHARRVAALSTSMKGVDLFRARPEMFEDDEDVIEDVDYKTRNYEYSDDEAAVAAE